MVILDLSRIDRKAQGLLELMSYLFLFGLTLSHILNPKLERPKRLAQLDNHLLWEKHIEFWNYNKLHEMTCMWVLDFLSFSLEHTHITDWETTLPGYQVELKWRLKVFSSAWFWISLHQGTLSCSYILKLT